MSLRKNPPLLSVVHGRGSCNDRFLVIGAIPYAIHVMILEDGGGEYGALNMAMQKSIAEYGETMGATMMNRGIWEFSHRESSCKNK